MNQHHPDDDPERGGDRSKIVALCLALVIVVIGSLWLRREPTASRTGSDSDEIVRPDSAKPASHLEIPKYDDLGKIPFVTARDRTPAEMIEWPDSLVDATLSWIQSVGEDRLRRETVTDVDWTELRRQPDHYRGRIVRVIGQYQPELQWLRRLDEDFLGRGELHEGLLKLSDDHRFRWIALDGPIPPPGTQSADDSDPRALVIEGVFLKNVAWLNAKSDLVSGPLIVATRLETLPIAGERSIATIAFVIIGLTAVCLMFCLFGIYSDGEKARDFQREYLAKRRRRIARTSTRDGDPSASQRRSVS